VLWWGIWLWGTESLGDEKGDWRLMNAHNMEDISVKERSNRGDSDTIRTATSCPCM